MAIAFVQSMGHGVSGASGSVHTFSPTATQSAVGDVLVLVMSDQGDSVTSVTDSKSNTWTVQKDFLNSGLDIAIATCKPVDSGHALATTDTITAHCSNTGFAVLWQIDEFSGLTETLDGTPATGTTTTLTLTTTNADDLLIAAYSDFHSGAVTFTAASGWTAGSTVDVGSPGSYHAWYQRKIVSASGSQSTSGTTISSGQISGAIIALQAVATDQTITVGKVPAPHTVHGAAVFTNTLSVGKISSGLFGDGTFGSGTFGGPVPTAVVRGVTLTAATLTMLVGKSPSPHLVRGVAVTSVMAVGQITSRAAPRGVTLLERGLLQVAPVHSLNLVVAPVGQLVLTPR